MRFDHPQRTFIQHAHQHIKLIAPPGSGKTEVASERILFLSQNGVNMKHVLATTFNVSAAQELRERLASKSISTMPIVRNYHKIGARMNRALMKKGFIPTRTIIDDYSTLKNLVTRSLESAIGFGKTNGSLSPYHPTTIDEFISFVGFVKSQTSTIDAAFECAGLDKKYSVFKCAYKTFETTRKEQGLQTIDDLVYDPVQALDSNKEAVKLVTNKLDFILGDEFQDINPITYRLLQYLAGDRAIMTFIGDDDQTINKFRGSEPSFIISGVSKDLPSIKTLKLLYTYRYGHCLSLCSNALIQHNEQRSKKLCLSAENAPRTKITVGYYTNHYQVPYQCHDQHSLINVIKRHQAKGESLADIGVLLRAYIIAPWIEVALLKAGIPYSLKDSKSSTSHYLIRAFNTFIRAIGSQNLSPVDIKLLSGLLHAPSLALRKDQYSKLLPYIIKGKQWGANTITNALPGVQAFIIERIVKRLNLLNKALTLPFHKAIKCFFIDHIFIEYEQLLEKRNNEFDKQNFALLTAYTNGALAFPSATDWLNQCDNMINAGGDAINLLSIHNAKGCAWSTVILPACVETILPYQHPEKTTSIEDERRLMYVAITRARNHLHIITAKRNSIESELKKSTGIPPNDIPVAPDYPSRFLFEMQLNDSINFGNAIHDGAVKTSKIDSEKTLFNDYINTLQKESDK
jgi:DNA helicase-2/ATP-dependent DNA helicase PcrA